MEVALLLIVGLLAGGLAAIFGVGGGVIVIPALVYLFGFSQKMAQGTTLAMLIPPIGLFAAYTYYKAGFVDVKAAAFLIIGFVIGSYILSRFIVNVDDAVLTKVFGALLLVLAIKMLVTK